MGQMETKHAPAMLIDLRNSNMGMRNLERQKLKNSFEIVLSFDLKDKHEIIDMQLDKAKRELSVDEAIDEYMARIVLKKQEKKVGKLVTAGFEDEDARKAIQMSNENSGSSEEKNKIDGDDDGMSVQNAEEVVDDLKIE